MIRNHQLYYLKSLPKSTEKNINKVGNKLTKHNIQPICSNSINLGKMKICIHIWFQQHCFDHNYKISDNFKTLPACKKRNPSIN